LVELRKCQAITKGGERCQRVVHDGSAYCYSHDPRRVQDRKQAASKGALVKQGSEIAQIKARIKEIAEGILSGQMDKARGSVTVQAYGVLKGYLELEKKQKEEAVLEELKQRMASIEARAQRVRGA